MSSSLTPFRLDLRQLSDIAITLEARVREGLAAEGRQVKGLPAHLRPPTPGRTGEAVVVDAGGTNVRAAHVRIGGPRDTILSGPYSGVLPVRSETPLDAAGFWSLQAELVARCAPPPGLPLGYCFSYPSSVDPDGDATLITWTKGIAIEGVVGARVGTALTRTLTDRGHAPSSAVVLNDTVAALLMGASFAEDPERVIGLICGTGTNMATFVRPEQAPKLVALGPEPMAVNLESGNFEPPHLNATDAALDEASNNPGRQRFEKAIAGVYLPYLFERLVPGVPDFDPAAGSGALVDVRDQGSGAAREAAEAILDRSADLVAAGLSGVARVLGGTEPITVLAEGSLIWKARGFADRVRATLSRLQPRGPTMVLERRDDANLYGSAVAALSSPGS